MPYIKPNDWVEDFEHENGNYANECLQCGAMFRGHKRRVTCKVCSPKIPATEITPPKTLGVGGEEKQAKLNPRQRYNRWADAKIAELTKELCEARACADKHRDTVMMYMYGNQPHRDDFPDKDRIRNPWEKGK